MEKNLEISLLLDFYRELLTEKQADAIDLYYNQDLSLGEISENLNITRQGVRDSLKRGEKQLLELEGKLGLAKRFDTIRKGLENIQNAANEIEILNTQKYNSVEMKNKIEFINDAIKKMIDQA